MIGKQTLFLLQIIEGLEMNSQTTSKQFTSNQDTDLSIDNSNKQESSINKQDCES